MPRFAASKSGAESMVIKFHNNVRGEVRVNFLALFLETPHFHAWCPRIAPNCSRERSLEHCHSKSFLVPDLFFHTHGFSLSITRRFRGWLVAATCCCHLALPALGLAKQAATREDCIGTERIKNSNRNCKRCAVADNTDALFAAETAGEQHLFQNEADSRFTTASHCFLRYNRCSCFPPNRLGPRNYHIKELESATEAQLTSHDFGIKGCQSPCQLQDFWTLRERHVRGVSDRVCPKVKVSKGLSHGVSFFEMPSLNWTLLFRSNSYNR